MSKSTRPLSEGHLLEDCYLWQFIFSNQPKDWCFLAKSWGCIWWAKICES